MAKFRTRFILSIIAISTCICFAHRNEDNTDLSKGFDDRPLLFTTLGGGIVALDQNTGSILWRIKDEPVVRVPNENYQYSPQFLPDPRHGSLYMFGTHAGERQLLKKLPFTIPQLVANAPCRSSDGILYTGKKIDTWFMIDPKTGIRKQVLGHDDGFLFEESKSNTCPLDPKSAIYVARTEYNILMYDSKSKNHRWNVTFFDYSSHNMGKEMSNDYGIVHFTSTSNGRVTSFDRKTGEMLWSHNIDSPIVATYLLDRDGLISVPFNTVGDDTMDHIIEDVSSLQGGKGFKHSNIELFPSLYIGEHVHGLYALSSLVDKNTITISADGPQPLLLEGPNESNKEDKLNTNNMPVYKPNVNIHYNIKKFGNEDVSRNYLLLGYYTIPEYAETNFNMLSKSTSISLPINFVKSDPLENTRLRLVMEPNTETKTANWYEIENDTRVNKGKEVIETPNDDNDSNLNKAKQSIASQTDFDDKMEMTWPHTFYFWLWEKQNVFFNILVFTSIIVIISILLYMRNQMLIFQQLSQSGSRYSNPSYNYNGQIVSVPEELENGSIKVGKIIFYPGQILGKGCDGTFVYRGTFENRDVAVKRLLPECFSFADREVALLSESDTHVNVVRYYCMEQDRLFRYIALELCAATLQNFVQDNLEKEYKINYLDILKQATAGLAHLHSLDIVHRDIKPHNVLLSMPNSKNPIRVMISDFGLCKKLNIGRHSFSRRSGVTGTDGWIAPEMLQGQRTTTSVDIFSLGCVFYYVLSKGIHPFGDVLERQAKILKGYYHLDHLSSTLREEEVDLATCLIKTMLSSDPQSRPTAPVVHKYPLFWNKHEVLTYLQDVSDRVEKDPPDGPLEYGALAVVRGDWRGRVCSSVAADLRRYRSYSGDSVRDLLRALRNKKHHYRELTLEAQTSLGSIPENFTSYWLKRFPKLLLHTWLQMQVFKHEVPLNMYYDESYVFDNKYIIQQIELEDLKKYEYENIGENNLFIKSRQYYDKAQGRKIKSRHVFEKRANMELENNEQDNNLPSEDNAVQGTPVKQNQNKDDKGEKKNVRFKNHRNQSNNVTHEVENVQQNNKLKKRLKNEESNVVWNLSTENSLVGD